MNTVDLGIWPKLEKLVIFLIIVAVGVGVVIWYSPILQQNERMRQAIFQLDQQIKAEEQAQQKLEVYIQALKNDPKTVERLAREKLGYAKPGETVIYFEAPPVPLLEHSKR